MGRRSIPEENIRNLQKSRRSYYLNLPIEMIRRLGWKERQKVVVEKRGREIVIKDWKK
ncbi:MAG: hypothetical protein HYS89_00230 [Candidatus Colwellbacteria bacterium]|nr:hypothetical protein [Candidatus Colwellbacteria bacterium]